MLDDELIYRRLFFVERSQRKPNSKKINPFDKVTSIREHSSMLFIPDTANEVNPVIQMEKLPNFRVQQIMDRKDLETRELEAVHIARLELAAMHQTHSKDEIRE